MNTSGQTYFVANTTNITHTFPFAAAIGEAWVDLYEGRLFSYGVTGGTYTNLASSGDTPYFEIGAAASGGTAASTYYSRMILMGG